MHAFTVWLVVIVRSWCWQLGIIVGSIVRIVIVITRTLNLIIYVNDWHVSVIVVTLPLSRRVTIGR